MHVPSACSQWYPSVPSHVAKADGYVVNVLSSDESTLAAAGIVPKQLLYTAKYGSCFFGDSGRVR